MQGLRIYWLLCASTVNASFVIIVNPSHPCSDVTWSSRHPNWTRLCFFNSILRITAMETSILYNNDHLRGESTDNRFSAMRTHLFNLMSVENRDRGCLLMLWFCFMCGIYSIITVNTKVWWLSFLTCKNLKAKGRQNKLDEIYKTFCKHQVGNRQWNF